MPTITTTRRNYKEGSTTDNQFIRIELEDGEILRYTDARVDLSTTLRNDKGTERPIAQVTYSSLMGFDLSSVGGSANHYSEVDLEGVLLPLGFSREQIAQGLFENARIYLFISNRKRFVEDEEPFFTGFWGETTTKDGRYITKFTSLISMLEVDTSRVISQFCDATLGSKRCGVSMTPTTRLGNVINGEVFDPMSSLGSKPIRWIDFSDANTLTVSGGRITRADDKALAGFYLTELISPTRGGQVVSINGRPACRLRRGDGYRSINPSGASLDFNAAFLPNNNYQDVYIVLHNFNNTTKLAIFNSSTNFSAVPTGPVAEIGSSSTDFYPGRVPVLYDSNLERIDTLGDFHTLSLSPMVFLLDLNNGGAGSGTVEARASAGWNQGSTVGGYNLGEILVYDRLRDQDRRRVLKYLTDKWGISSGSPGSREGQTDNDAKTRKVIAVDGIDYVWFEAFGNGDLDAVEPIFDPTINSSTYDGDITWRAIPARVFEMTLLAGEGLDSQLTTVEALPADLTGEYVNGKIEFITGPNRGAAFVIIENTTNVFSISQPTLVASEAGDIVRITVSCDKTVNACNVYRNGINFQGFANIPTKNNIFKIGDK